MKNGLTQWAVIPLMAGMIAGCHAQGEGSAQLSDTKPAIKLVPGTADIKPVSQERYGRHPGDKPMHKETLLEGTLEVADNKSVRGNTVVNLLVTNPQSYGVPIQFNSGMTGDLWLVTPKGQSVWTWSHDMMFTQAIRNTSIAPGKTMTVSFEVPADVMAKVKSGYEWQARFMGHSTESPVPLLSTVSMKVN